MFDWKEPQSHDIITSYTNTIRETRDTKEERFDQKSSVLRQLRKCQSVLRGNDGMNEGEEEGDEVNHLIVGKLLRYIENFTLTSLPFLRSCDIHCVRRPHL